MNDLPSVEELMNKYHMTRELAQDLINNSIIWSSVKECARKKAMEEMAENKLRRP